MQMALDCGALPWTIFFFKKSLAGMEEATSSILRDKTPDFYMAWNINLKRTFTNGENNLARKPIDH